MERIIKNSQVLKHCILCGPVFVKTVAFRKVFLPFFFFLAMEEFGSGRESEMGEFEGGFSIYPIFRLSGSFLFVWFLLNSLFQFSLSLSQIYHRIEFTVTIRLSSFHFLCWVIMVFRYFSWSHQSCCLFLPH